MQISVVIPVYNESDLIDELFEAVMSAMKKFTDDFEVICVNDGSKDNTLEKLFICHQKDKRFKVLNLSEILVIRVPTLPGSTTPKANLWQ